MVSDHTEESDLGHPIASDAWTWMDWLLRAAGAGNRVLAPGTARDLKRRIYTRRTFGPDGAGLHEIDVGNGARLADCLLLVLEESGYDLSDQSSRPTSARIASIERFRAICPSRRSRLDHMKHIALRYCQRRDEIFDEAGCARQLAQWSDRR